MIGIDRVINKGTKEAPIDYWDKVIGEISKRIGTGCRTTPTDFKSDLITELFGIPQGRVSGLGIEKLDTETRRIDSAFDKLMAEYFTNDTYIVKEINEVGAVTTQDPREFGVSEDVNERISQAKARLEEFKEKLNATVKDQERRAMGEQLYNILKEEFKLKEVGLEFCEKRGKPFLRTNQQLEIKYLPGGNPVILRGYLHDESWHKKFGESLARIYSEAPYITIEGFCNISLGKSNPRRWSNPKSQQGTYDELMKQLVDHGFKGKFLEIDARNEYNVSLDDNTKSLQKETYQAMLQYFQKENPLLAKQFKNDWQELKKIYDLQITENSVTQGNFHGLSFDKEGVYYNSAASIKPNKAISATPTGMEMASVPFTDALVALKLHMLSEGMNKGVIKKGLIVDFEGSNHLSYKSFFLKYPRYAVEVVLRSLGELMKDNMKKEEDTTIEYKNLNWKNILKEIGRVHIGHIEDAPDKTTEIGPDQKKYTTEKEFNLFDTL